ncbi:hypothetical protein [Faecalibacter bovis]|uniref:DNRLRE domain-containing protein n=1 Tax=Faecalibacter bovis TaxID=2898187 RepID=A0ABX7XCE8_9FLAO|nr:hypothetical protein [Faecalibacter bovis]QTV05499.1 hypothetical protein J9309_12105 [Faecalibacter bovis]
MKKLSSGALVCLAMFTYAQVGINTEKPETALHIEAKETAKGLKLVDGTQGNGKVLMSDKNGIASWKSLFSADEIYGTYTWAANTNINNVNWNSIANLKVTPVTHMIYYRIHILNNNSSLSSTRNVYNRVYVSTLDWSKVTNQNTKDTPIIGTTGFQGLQGNDLEIALSFMYTNKSDTDETLFLNFQSDRNSVRRSKYAQQTPTEFKNVNLIENYFYSVKIN